MHIQPLTLPAFFRLGHAQDFDARTGCTVILCPEGAVAGVDQRGGAPGTRETDLLRPMHWVTHVHGLLLSGGSAFGLDAATGVMRYLEEQGAGFETGVGRVPIVPAAVLFDLAVGRADVRPDATMGYAACVIAQSGPVAEGRVGAGTGATVGKILGMGQAMPGGLGAAMLRLGEEEGDLWVGAVVAVNAVGDVIEPVGGEIMAGARLPDGSGFADSLAVLGQMAAGAAQPPMPLTNTVIGTILTNAMLTKEQVNKVAQMAQDGLARTIRPAHTLMDGDTIFALATGEVPADVNVVGAYAAEVMAAAIVRGVSVKG
ncbi:MAG: P1 family peptidase [Caldilineaceae bacterium]|nr:P1 family peptidase [Caldilineaceae bacterium]MBP9073484.1 P1 family peptidase [Caldilineaceae bacterium]